MYILIVEDDNIQYDLLQNSLQQAIPNLKIRVISTEYEFRSRFNQIVLDPPDVVILDMILRWTDASPEMSERPADVQTEGPYRAGFRCQKMLASQPPTSRIPVIIFTILEIDDLKSQLTGTEANRIFYVTKDSDYSNLINLILAVGLE